MTTNTNPRCGSCDKTDGLLYASAPPRVKCTVSGEYHGTNDECDQVAHSAKNAAGPNDPHETCQYCAHELDSAGSFPCSQCSLNYTSQFKPKPRFTEDEVAAMRVLYAAGVRELERNDSPGIITANGDAAVRSVWYLPNLFPSLRPGTSVTIEAVLKEAQHE